MPKGPKGEKRPANVIGNAVKVMRIAVVEDTDTASLSLGAAHFDTACQTNGNARNSPNPKSGSLSYGGQG